MLNRFKDNLPTESIEKRKAILKNIGIPIKEEFFQNTDNIWSGWVESPILGLSTNGKGSSEEYCRASAYGEFFERLQNYFCGIRWNNLPLRESNKRLLTIFPDENFIKIKNCLDNFPEIIEDFCNRFTGLENRDFSGLNELYALIETYLNNYNNITLSVPFYHVNTDSIVDMPYEILTILTGTNGMCSGNSPEEALVQGLSEICERYAEHKIFQENLTPPEITREYLSKYPFIIKLIEELEDLSKNKVKVYDCSLGKGFPVVSIALFDTESLQYRLQFGSHPLMEIAIERCLTEFLQGYYLFEEKDRIRCMSNIEDNPMGDENNLLFNRFITGNGSFPISFFYKTPSWEFTEWCLNKDTYDNKIGYNYFIDLFKANDKNIYIRNNSVLGIPAYYIYIPGISPKYIGLSWSLLESFLITDSFKDFGALSKHLKDNNLLDDLSELCENYLEFLNTSNREYINFYGEMYDEDNLVLRVDTEDFLKAIIYKELGNYRASSDFLNRVSKNSKYIKALKLENHLCDIKVDEVDRDYILSTFFEESIIAFINRYWRGNDGTYNIFEWRPINKSTSTKNTEVSLDIREILYNIEQNLVEVPQENPIKY